MLIVNFLPLFLAISATRATSLPADDESAGVLYISSPVEVPAFRQKRSAFPDRAMVFHGYFGNGRHRQYPNPATSHHGYESYNIRRYDPQGSMTAFAAGNTISAGSSYYGGGGGGGGPDCRNCDSANKPANGNGTKKNGNGPSNGNGRLANGNGIKNNGNGPSNGNGRPANGNGAKNNGKGPSNGNGRPANGKQPNQHEVPSDTPVVDNKLVNGNGQYQTPVWHQDVGFPHGNGNGDYMGDQPAAEEVPKGDSLPSTSSIIPLEPEDGKKGPAAEDSEDEEEEDEPPFFSRGKGRGKGRGPYGNSYFPMIFGFYPGVGAGKQGNREGGNVYNPGSATAIANSFSTGKGSVATSHAIAYGGPHLVPSGYRINGSRGRPY